MSFGSLVSGHFRLMWRLGLAAALCCLGSVTDFDCGQAQESAATGAIANRNDRALDPDASTALRLPNIFADHMVLQADRGVPLWGWGAPQREVAVRWEGQEHRVTVDQSGKWRLDLPRCKAGGPRELTVSCGDESVTFQDVWVGEVWLCSGQSNMQWSLKDSDGAADEIPRAIHQRLRLCNVPMEWDDEARDDCAAEWSECRPEAAATFSAVAYYFGKRLMEDLDTPVGLIGSYWGGTPAESWTSPAALQGHPLLKPLVDESKPNSEHPQNQPSVLYHAMISPLVPYGVRGAIWYQGESNVGRAAQYEVLFPTMIRDWRHRWGQGDFPFYFVQIAPFRYEWTTPEAYCELCEAQTSTLRVPNTGMVVTNDISDVKDIHPRNKRAVGERLARLALSRTYGRRIGAVCGPLYAGCEMDGARIRVHFHHAGSGLATRDGRTPTGFTIAGVDHVFHDAVAIIDGRSVVVSSPDVIRPRAVRFAWSDTSLSNLINREGLPAAAFRTDSFWP
ncbi:MAG TPA: sialate O-acetylesterase [Pirellulaceae bacterium]